MSILTNILVLLLVAIGGPTRNVEEKEIRGAIEAFVRAAMKDPNQQYAVEYRNLPSKVMNIPEHARLQIVVDPGQKLRGAVLLPVEVFADDHVAHTFLVSVRIKTFGTILTADRSIDKYAAGEAIPVSRVAGETTSLPIDVISDPASLKGKRCKKIIRRGEVLTESMFEQLPIVNPGNPVTLIVKTTSVTIKAKAIVRQSGGQGDVIVVQKEGRGDRLKARVIDENTVELLAQN